MPVEPDVFGDCSAGAERLALAAGESGVVRDYAAGAGEDDGIGAEIVCWSASASRLRTRGSVAMVEDGVVPGCNQAGQSRDLEAAARSATGAGREATGLTGQAEGVRHTADVAAAELRS